MKPTNAKRRSYTASFKLKVIEVAKAKGNRAAGREFSIDESVIRGWIKLEKNIQKMPAGKMADRAGICKYPELEANLKHWVTAQRDNGRAVSNPEIRLQALKMAGEMQLESFGANPSWCHAFMKRHNLSQQGQMGSSKKHKEKDKEHKKKKKHKERSRSRSRERRHKKKHSRSGHEYSPEAKVPKLEHVEDGEVSEDDRFADEMLETLPIKIEQPRRPVKAEASNDIPEPSSAGGDLTLSIEATNKLRAKLGLKPLEGASGEGKKGSTSQKEDVHVPAVNLSSVRKQKALKEKLDQAKERRKIKDRLRKVKKFSEQDDEDALAWVRKSRKQEQDRLMADKRAKALEEMDEEFGIGDLVEEEFGSKRKNYSSKDLKGLEVQHGQDSFKEGKTVILTLKDKGVLEEEEGDVLVNVNIQDEERAKENIDNRLKKPTYKPYDDGEIDEYGMLKPKEILEKYNEEIDGKSKEKFELGSGGKYDAQHERRMKEIKAEFQQQSQALVLPAPIVQREFYTEQEMEGFNKVKKKVRKIRKKPKVVTADDLIQLNEPMQMDHGSRSRKRQRPQEEGEEGELIEDMKREPDAIPVPIPGLDLIGIQMEEAEAIGPDEDLTGVTVDDEAGIELELALNKARRLKDKKKPSAPENFAINIEPVMEESDEESEDEEAMREMMLARNMSLNQTSEFCRSLGEITNYGRAGNRREDEEDELLDFEREMEEERRKREEEDEEQNPGWQEVEIDNRPVDITETNDQNVLDDEPMLNEGMASALELATKKGYIDAKAGKKSRSNKSQQSEIEALNYSIEDKRYDDLDEKFRKRDRFGGGGMVSDFKEKNDYKPEVKIKYRDDQGRDMSAKEAFRYLSHRFHGKGSGKMKTEKRQKKWEQEQTMKSMTSTDTPLGSAAKLGEKLHKEKTPFIVLSGANKNNPTTLTKT